MILLGLCSVLQHGNPIVFCGDTTQETIDFEATVIKKKLVGNTFSLETSVDIGKKL
jgi:hypothetical protein